MKNTMKKPVNIPISKLRPFEGHPFKVKDDAEMNTLIESIQTVGILSPLIVRPIENTEGYEVISGHRRLHAAVKAGITEVPALIYALDRDSAAIAVVDSNLHREHILPSEKAFAYKLKMEALNHQGITCGQKLYEIFAATRSIKKTADKMNELGYRTKVGSKFNSSTTRLLLKNPVYCTADESAYNYFLEHNGGLCGDISDFDGQHGISAYNKTDQEKFEDADSTFISPKFVQLMSTKPLSEWIISVGRHEGFISSQQWIDTQNMLDDIAEKYNRPHRKTNALLAGLVYCPHCGKRLRVISESNRWTNGKPRFKYVCPGYRVGECTFRAVDGVLLDEFVVQQLSHLADEDSEYFEKLLNQKASDIFSSSQNEKELSDLRKKKAQLEAAISNQVKNLREADNSLKRFIQEDVKALTDELSETETLLQKLEDSRQSQMYAIRDIEEIKERLLSFGKYAENAAPDVLVTLIQTFVERIYITDTIAESV